MKTKLIVRTDFAAAAQSELTLRFPGIYESHAIDRMGEDIVFGQSDVPGIWRLHAIGRLESWARAGDSVDFRFVDIRRLPESITIVTEGDPESDRHFAPYMIDTLLPEEMAGLLPGKLGLEQALQTPIVTLAEGYSEVIVGSLVGGLHFEAQGKTFFHKAAAAYSQRCAISHMRQSSIDGLAQEGVVIAIDEPFVRHEGAERDGLFLSSSFAFAYRYGLLAIGDDYELLRHQTMEAEMRMFLEIANRKAMLRLPEDPAHWPDLDAARRHRNKFGY